MSLQKMPVRSSVKAFLSSQHLLFQFIWSELLLTHHQIVQIKSLTKKIEEIEATQDIQSTLEALKPHFSKLSGSARESMRLFYWDDDGILTKLKNYCVLFSHYESSEGKNYIELSHEANKLWLLSLEALDMLDLVSNDKLNRKIDDFIKLLGKIYRHLTRFKRLVAESVLTFHSDENVLLFMWRHQQELDQMHKRGFIRSILCTMYSGGVEEARDFIIKKYTQRGFSELLPFIRSKII